MPKTRSSRSSRALCGDTDLTLGPGAFAYLPRGVPHTFWVQGNKPARMLAVFTPGGVEQMFADAGEPTDSAQLPEGNGTPPGGLEALTARYKVEHIGPPLGALREPIDDGEPSDDGD